MSLSFMCISLFLICGYSSLYMVFSFFFLMIRRPPRSTQSRSSAASDVYKRQVRVKVYDRAGNETTSEPVRIFIARKPKETP